MSSHPSKPSIDEEKWGPISANVGRVLLGVAAGVVMTLLVQKWNDSNMGDEAKANARDLKHTAEQKGREIRDSWR
ncbi:hypothetical protein WJX81_000784 [Elliptochloris bilobata]|uniref:Uncharacterized protein n=1 Tax=Elliptochloris bilobata TaxID=381761 RepID=A0AAW1QXR2_9CHLO